MRKVSEKAQAKGLRVEKFIAGYAYARNGNAHNPTPRVEWLVKDASGRVVDHAGRQKDAVQFADELADSSE